MARDAGVLFDERFLDRHAGAIIGETSVSIVELVANAWDAYATEVEIAWPSEKDNIVFSIRDNGRGMTAAEFEKRWMKIDYNRVVEEGTTVDPPKELKDFAARRTYGRNGRGRHAAFRFSDPYRIRTWCDGTEVEYEVRRGVSQPFAIRRLGIRKDVDGHGTEVTATARSDVAMTAGDAREVLGTRFLADPNFTVYVDGTKVSFGDVPAVRLKDIAIPIPPFGSARIVMIDALRADKTTRQHGIAWRVKNRLVGTTDWIGFDDERILDGRTTEAKRFTFIVIADHLDHAVRADWSGFESNDEVWQKTKSAVHDAIKGLLSASTAQRRKEVKESIKINLEPAVRKLAPVGRDRWNQFVDIVVENCPSISQVHIEQVSGVLANLELATSKYGLINKLHEMPPGDLDQLHQILVDWTVRTAKIALDEIQMRLQLIKELDEKLRDEGVDEVSELQPLFERSLWVFGPEFESIEFTSNKGMTEVIRQLFGKKEMASRQRPDFVLIPDGSVGFYSRDSHDLGHEVDGVARLVIAEIKKVGVIIGSSQKDQAWKYVKGLIQSSHVTKATSVTCFVLGSRVDPTESADRKEWDDRVIIRPMSYNVFVRRAETRMLGLREKLRSAPFLNEHGFDAEHFVNPPFVQEELSLGAEGI
jgi:hypothetical protein